MLLYQIYIHKSVSVQGNIEINSYAKIIKE